MLVSRRLAVLFLVFTFFELIGDIVKYRTPLVTVGDYLLNLIPFIVYDVTPLCSLARRPHHLRCAQPLVRDHRDEGYRISLYRVVAPMLVVAAVLAVLLFAFDERISPPPTGGRSAPRQIKGKPAQTFLRPDRKWISGQTTGSGEPERIFYYQAFDPDRDVFANITVFEFEPRTFTLSRRIYAESAHWEPPRPLGFENGWSALRQRRQRDELSPFQDLQLPRDSRAPRATSRRKTRPSKEMSYSELASYIATCSQSGFDTTPLRVQLNRKLSYPLLTLVMAILAVPFSLAGKRGEPGGIGAALALAILYWVLAGISRTSAM